MKKVDAKTFKMLNCISDEWIKLYNMKINQKPRLPTEKISSLMRPCWDKIAAKYASFLDPLALERNDDQWQELWCQAESFRSRTKVGGTDIMKKKIGD